jgi:hypothetical protein
MLIQNIISNKQYEIEKSKLLNIEIVEDSEIKIQTNQKLIELDKLLEDELITTEDYEIKRRDILKEHHSFSSIKDFGCILNYTNKFKKNISKVMCFCMNSSNYSVSYVISNSTIKNNICQGKIAIPYQYYINNSDNEFHNKNTTGIGEKLYPSKEEIEKWNKERNRKKTERKKNIKESKKLKKNNDNLFRSYTPYDKCNVKDLANKRIRCGCTLVRDRNNNLVCHWELD